MSMNAVAARRVAASANSPAEAREFLLMLGIIDEAGTLLPDQTRDVAIGHVNRLANAPKVGGRNRFMDRPERSTAPETLRVLAPPTVRKQATPRAPSQLAGPPQGHNQQRMQPCGTRAAARRHVRNREPLCDACAKGREERRGQKNATRVYNVADCGTRAGFDRHRRHGTEACQPCRDAYNESRRNRRAKAREKAGLPPVAVRNQAKCGGSPGLKRHYRLGEKPCEQCLAWKRAQNHKETARKQAARALNPPPPREPKPITHGTAYGYKQHYARGIPMCDECRAYKARVDAASVARKKAQNGDSK